MTLSNDTKPETTGAEKSVVLIAKGDAITFDVSKVVMSLPNHTLEAQAGTLAGMNGTAVELVRNNDLVIFETTSNDADDVSAVANLSGEHDDNAKILVITPADISLAQARLLTRAGADEVLTHPFDAEEMREQIERLTSPNPLLLVPQVVSQPSALGKVFAVAKSCGGVGGTTVAVNLADQLQARTGVLRKKNANRVVLVDLDLQFGSVASFVDVDAQDSLFHMAVDGGEPDATFLQQSLVQSESGISVLTAPMRFAPLDSLGVAQVSKLIELLREEFDYVVVDLPHALIEWVAPVLEQTSRLLMVTDGAVPSIRQARRLIDFYSEDNVGLAISIVMNREKKPLLKSSAHKEAAKVLERPLNCWLPNDPKAARASIDRGQPLSAVSGRSPLTKAIKALARTLVEDASASNSVNLQKDSK